MVMWHTDRGRSSDFLIVTVPIAFPHLTGGPVAAPCAPIDGSQVTAAGLRRSLTDFPIIPGWGTSS
jgi:hypothetical protein